MSNDSYVCNGGNYSVSMTPQTLIVKPRGRRQGLERTIPLSDVQSVILERKSLMPIASSAILLGIIGVLVKYNALWFLYDLNKDIDWKISLITFLAAALLAVPTAERTLFVNVIITSLKTETWRVSFVRSNTGRRFAAKFHELSSGA